jgi:hypothetical protein
MLLPATKPWAWQVLIGAGLLSAALSLYDLITIPKTLRPDNFTCPSGVSCTFHQTIGPGVWFTLITSLLIAAGAYVHHIRPVPFRSPGAHPVASPVASPAASPAVSPVAKAKRRIVDLTKR